ncbi:MAG TPA: Mrp/NBP35 family ATP-binding protein [Phycisphaerae bacterium]|nr:Mrp/NBP35 family ATP-binding protein [Phycisphaerae bacterium]HOM53783.1 Mrp/NBP35 family ATP-binding protein [Phycisphaerae bacterium]HPP29200.1 Mrp/NBP35 family ATP-binding protein [Phycisphaerae bacterium]HPZ96954.1 Mrp/NBP35 family ATP-binding protein [Phycisphaerae bacterium]
MEEEILAQRMDNIRQKIVVMSGKGGVGKSTVAVNLAVGLSQAGMSVGLLDVDVHGPSIPQLLGMQGQGTHLIEHELQAVRVNDRLSVMSIGFLVTSPTDAVIWRGPRKYALIRQFLKDVNWGRLDYLVIDSPPGTGDEPLAVAQLVGKPATAVLVTTPQELAVNDVRRSVSFCRAVDLPVLGIIENMSGFACPACGHRIDIFKTGGGESLAAEMNVRFLGKVPLDPAVVSRGDSGEPQTCLKNVGGSAQAFRDVVQAVLDHTRAGRVELKVL